MGSTVPRKRIDILIRVFSEVKKKTPNVRLIRSGGSFTADQTMMIEKLGLRDSVTVLPFLERRHLASVYRRASVVLQPSEREGFGLPVIEAMASGTPIVASDFRCCGKRVAQPPSIVMWKMSLRGAMRF